MALDNDIWARKAVLDWLDWLFFHGYDVDYLAPDQAKDWNEVLKKK